MSKRTRKEASKAAWDHLTNPVDGVFQAKAVQGFFQAHEIDSVSELLRFEAALLQEPFTIQGTGAIKTLSRKERDIITDCRRWYSELDPGARSIESWLGLTEDSLEEYKEELFLRKAKAETTQPQAAPLTVDATTKQDEATKFHGPVLALHETHSPQAVSKWSADMSMEGLTSNDSNLEPTTDEHKTTQRLAEFTLDRSERQQDPTKRTCGSDVLTLNIGGEETVETLRSTLTPATGSKLAEMFSGRWDESLPKSKDGSFFIDREPELFLPLLRFLRDLSSMVPEEVTNPLPPLTPSFKNPKDEASFRRMVDSYSLTNVVYNYEVFKAGYYIEDHNCRSIVSRHCSIFDCPLPDGDGCDYPVYLLDRLRFKQGACHERQVQAFEVTLSQLSSCVAGWSRSVQVYTEEVKIFQAGLSRIYFSSRHKKLVYYDHEENCKASEQLDLTMKENAIIRCSKNVETRELEFYVDGTLVVRTSRSTPRGFKKAVDSVLNIGWTCPTECELIPFIQTESGSCRFSALELES